MPSASRFNTVFAAVLTLALSSAAPAQASYDYLHNEGEYSITLPDAPSGETIWHDQRGHIPFIDQRPKFGALGEQATYRRTDATTGDSFNVDITFIKSGRDYLLNQTEDSIRKLLEQEYSNQTLEQKKISLSSGTGTLKWGVLTGFSVDRNNNLLFHSCHILTGYETVTMIKIAFNADNEKFGEQYQTLKESIKFVGTK